jgi:salicylate hydroxylase
VHYYVRRGELVNCVCVVEQSGWTVESWTEPGERGQLGREFAGWHSSIRTLIDNIDPETCYRWALFDRPPMPRWSRGRVTLLGDACHPTLPFQAQGAAMAIEDAAVLARCLAAGPAISESLARYESLRRARTAQVQAGSRRNARVFHLSGPAAWLRNRAVGLASGRVMDGLYRYDALDAE